MTSIGCSACWRVDTAPDPVTHAFFMLQLACIGVFWTHMFVSMRWLNSVISQDDEAEVGEDGLVIVDATQLAAIDAHSRVVLFESGAECARMSNCAICVSAYAAGDRVRVLNCSHDFHAACVNPWLSRVGRW